MTLWIDRRELIADGHPATHAVVIGVSAYRHLPERGQGPSRDPLTYGLGQLTTAASSAFMIACWFRDRFCNPSAPLGTIELLLSPSGEELRADPNLPPVEPATRENVEDALLRWKRRCRGSTDSVAVFYAAGHGAQVSRNDPVVLLEDFARNDNVLNYSVDVGLVHRGMAGQDMAQTQLFFVDACRIWNETFARFRTLGTGVGLPEDSGQEDRRSAPVYFGANPNGHAYATRSAGSLFSQALVECLESWGADDQLDRLSRWRVTTDSLLRALTERTELLAKRHGADQSVVGGGQMRTAPFHYFAEPPEFPLTVGIDPGAAQSVAWARLWNGADPVLDGAGFTSNPMTWSVPGGVYHLHVAIDPQTPLYRSSDLLPVAVLPHPTERSVVVSVSAR